MKNILIILFIFIISCSEIDTLKSSFDDSKVTLSLQNLKDPAAGMYYEAWLKPSSGASSSLGLLVKNQDTYELATTITHEQNFEGQLIFISIEKDDVPGMRFTQSGDTLFTPTANVISCCVISANQGEFSSANGFITSPKDANAVTTEFLMENAAASVRIFTPTQSDDDDLSGLWFTEVTIENNDTTISGSINMPGYENGWTYEAFITTSGQKISLGKFVNPFWMDTANPYSGPERNEFTIYPGEDFINNAPSGLSFPLDLSNAVVSVTLTPVFTDTAIVIPFETLLFEGTIPAGYNAGDNVVLDPVLTSLPTGNIKIELDLYN